MNGKQACRKILNFSKNWLLVECKWKPQRGITYPPKWLKFKIEMGNYKTQDCRATHIDGRIAKEHKLSLAVSHKINHAHTTQPSNVY